MVGEKENRILAGFTNPVYHGYAIGVVVIFVIVYLLAPTLLFYPPRLTIGEVVSRDIKAPTNLEILDLKAIQREQHQAVSEVPVVYDLDPEVARVIDDRIVKAFAAAREELVRSGPPKIRRATYPSDQEFQQALGLRLAPSSLEAFRRLEYDKATEDEVRLVLRTQLGNGILSGRSFLSGERERGIVIRNPAERKEQLVKHVLSIPDLKEAQGFAQDAVAEAFLKAPGNPALATAAGELTSRILAPNLALDRNETEARKAAAESTIKPLYYKVKKGDLLFRLGDRVAHEDRPVLQELHKYQRKGFVLKVLFGLSVMVAAILTILYLDIRRYRSPMTRDVPRLILLGLILIGTIAISKFSYFLLTGFVDKFPVIEPASLIYAIPVTAGAMLITLLLDTHMGLIFSFIMSLLMGIAMPEEPYFSFYAFVGSVAAVFSVITCHRRTQLLRAGLMVSIANLVMVGAIDLYRGSDLNLKVLFDLAFAAGGGLLAGVVVSGVLPVLESLFKITTDIRLLELLDLNHPLLRRLSITAPGTYFHSMMVSNLAEAATESVGENPLMARVCCYYHDIGKIVKPDYYIENQMGPGNRHDRLTPHMSSLVVVSHVKEGIDLARKYKLPQAVVDIIPQHHGTRLINYFYNRAMQARTPDQPPISDSEYRYPGPRPQTKTAGIIMLADAVEAASRVLKLPTPPRVAALVEKLINNIYLDGQLDESDLTLKDLKLTQQSFVKVLAGQFHKRIEYPGMGIPDHGDQPHEDLDREPAATHPPTAGKLHPIGRKGSS